MRRRPKESISFRNASKVRKTEKLWTNAHARNSDGECYKFHFKGGKAEPVKA